MFPIAPVLLLLGLLLAGLPATAAEPLPTAAAVVRAEALRMQHDPAGRPLPLVAHWHRSSLPLGFQIQMLRDGYPVLPWLDYHRNRVIPAADLQALQTLRTWGLPLVMLSGRQWEEDFYRAPEYEGAPLNATGLADDLEGMPVKKVSPLSPVEPWRKLGQMWTNNNAAKAIEAAYPDPPLVLFISNNEAADLKPTQAETSKTYLDLYGSGRTDTFKRKLFGDGWITRYAALFQGMREGLTEPAWKSNSLFAGYNAFAPRFLGKNSGTLVTEDRLDPSWYMWDGAVVESYDNHWEPYKLAFNLWSMQIENMNLVYMKEEAYAVNPNFWFELIVADADTWSKDNLKAQLYRSAGVSYTPDLYKGWVQYSMWTVVPRVVREWRASDDDRTRWWHYFQVILDSVRAVHDQPTLTRFWREGQLVPNLSQVHPFRLGIPDKWANVPRWYHLTTNLDPDWSNLPKYVNEWADDGHHFPVWTLARVIGETPKREWLVYAHAPMGNRTDVTVDIPGFKKVSLPRIDIAGTFYHVAEESGAVTEVVVGGTPPKRPAPPTDVKVTTDG